MRENEGGGDGRGSRSAGSVNMSGNGGLVRQTGRSIADSRGQSGESGRSMRSKQNTMGIFLHGSEVDYEEDLQAEIMKQKEE